MSILRLPFEILEQIVQELCPHCTMSSELPLSQAGQTVVNLRAFSSFYRQHKATLNAVAKTCRKLNQITQPILFHITIPEDSESSVQASGASLICALLQRPDLARAVKVLLIPEAWYFGDDWNLTKSQVEILDKAWKALLLRPSSSFTRSLSPPRHFLGVISKNAGNRYFATCMASLLIDCIQNNVTALFVGDWIPSSHYLPSSLPCLTQLFHCGEDESDLDPSTLNPEGLMSILDVSGALKTLVMNYILFWPKPPDEINVYHHIQRLVIRESCMEALDLFEIVKGMPNLVYFEFTDNEGLNWESGRGICVQIGDILQPIHRTLKTLCLRLSVYEPDEGVGPTEQPLALQSLKHLGRLEELTFIREICEAICLPLYEPRSLVDLVPTSLKKLILWDWYHYEAFLLLAQAVGSGEVQNLQQIHFYTTLYGDNDISEIDKVILAFREVGVQFLLNGANGFGEGDTDFDDESNASE